MYKLIVIWTIVCLVFGAPVENVEMDAKSFAAKEFVSVNSRQEAFDRIQKKYDTQLVVYEIKNEDSLLFWVDETARNQQPPPSDPERIVEDDSDNSAVIPMGVLDKFKSAIDYVPDKLDKHEGKILDKAGKLVPDKIKDINDKAKLKPKPSPLMKKKGYWVLQKVDKIAEKILPDLIPVTPCLDSTEGDGGSISVSYSTSFAIDKKVERTFTTGWIVFVRFKDSKTNSKSQSHSYSVSGTIPKGQKGQLFVKSGKFVSNIIKQTLFEVSDIITTVQNSQIPNYVFDTSHPFEFIFITNDKQYLKCAGTPAISEYFS